MMTITNRLFLVFSFAFLPCFLSAQTKIDIKEPLSFCQRYFEWYKDPNGDDLTKDQIDSLAQVLSFLENPATDIQLSKNQLKFCKTTCLLCLAWIDYSDNNVTIGMKKLTKAEGFFLETDVLEIRAEVLNLSSLFNQKKGSYKEAIKASQDAQKIYRSLGKTFEVAKEYLNQAIAYNSNGNYKNSIAHIKEAFKIIDPLIPESVQLRRGDTLSYWLNAYNSMSIANQYTAMQHFLRDESKDSIIRYIDLSTTDLDEPLQKSNSWGIQINARYDFVYINVGHSFYLKQTLGNNENYNALDKAIKYFNLGRQYSERGPLSKSNALVSLAQAFAYKNDFDTAFSLLNEGFRVIDKIPESEVKNYFLARLLPMRGDILKRFYNKNGNRTYLDSSDTAYQKAVNILNNSSFSIDLETIASPRYQIIFVDAVKSALRLYDLTKDENHLQRAFYVSEMSKNFKLRQLLKQQAVNYAPNDYFGNIVTPVADIQKKLLNDTTALISYFFQGDAPVAFVITKNSFKYVHLTKNTSFWTHFNSHIKALTVFKNIDVSKQDSKVLFDFLLKKPLEAIGTAKIGKLLISPDASLQKVAFESLMLPTEDYVLENYVVDYTYSIAGYEYLTKIAQTRQSNPNKVIALIAQVDGRDTLRMMEDFATKVFPKQVKYKCHANDFFDAAKHNKVVFFVGHGETDTLDPLNNALLMYDSILPVKNILSGALPTQLIVLGSCETEKDDLSMREDISTIARSLLSTGCLGVTATLNKVRDADAADIYKVFFDNLLVKKLPSDLALNLAKRQYIIQNKGKTNRYRSIDNWANIIFIGLPSIITD